MATWSEDQRLDNIMGNLLRTGVVLAAAVVLAGGILFLARHGSETADRRTFHGEPAELRQPVSIIDGAFQLDARALIQAGLLILIATPVARVAFSVATFALRREWIYVGLTVFVLAVLLYSLFAALR
jgi:uncharacterized membrane protein